MGDLTVQQLLVIAVVVFGFISTLLDALKKGPPEAPTPDAEPDVVIVPAEEAPTEERPRTGRALPPEPLPTPRRPVVVPPQPLPPPQRPVTVPPQPVPMPARRAMAQPPAAMPARRAMAQPPVAPTFTALSRPRHRRARISPAVARRGLVLMMILGPCRAMQPASEGRERE